jgi:hypothetical protein
LLRTFEETRLSLVDRTFNIFDVIKTICSEWLFQSFFAIRLPSFQSLQNSSHVNYFMYYKKGNTIHFLQSFCVCRFVNGNDSSDWNQKIIEELLQSK